jgi:hypothetical protein
MRGQGHPQQVAELLKVTRLLDAATMGTAREDVASIRALEARRAELLDELRRNDPRSVT